MPEILKESMAIGRFLDLSKLPMWQVMMLGHEFERKPRASSVVHTAETHHGKLS